VNALDLFNKTDGNYKLKLDKGQRMLFVSRSGHGKSTALVSFPNKIYTFDMDNRFRGVAPSIKWLGEEQFKNIDFDFYNPKDGFEAIDAKLNTIANLAEKRQCPYKTIGIESVGTLLTMLALDSQRRRGMTDKSGSKGFGGKVRGKVEFLHPDDYNYVVTAMRLLVYNYIFPLNEMGINTVFSAWVTDKWGKSPNHKEFDPPEVIGERIIGPGNTVEEVMGHFDEIYYFRKYKAPIPGQQPKFTVEFNGSFAKTAYPLPTGEIDVTGKNFFQEWERLIDVGMTAK
jgi:energy-coupling factor transporter ATP-binding protein EcfA2